MSKLKFGVWVLGSYLLACTRPAAAQTVNLPFTGAIWTSSRIGRRPSTFINIADCMSDGGVSFYLSVTGFSPSSTLEVWAGAGCDVLINRELDSGLCWKLGESQTVISTNPPPINVRVRDLLYGRTLAATSKGVVTAAEACTDQQPSSYPTALTVYFMMVDPAENIEGTFATWSATYKLTPPAAPTITSAKSRDSKIQIDFAGDQNDATIDGYEFFCEPDENALTSDAGVTTCDPPVGLIPGADVSASANCGTASRTASNGITGPVPTTIPCHVAAAATDTYGNVSAFSNVLCVTPQPSQNNPTARACNVARAPGARQAPWSSFALLGVALAACLRRRRTAR